jgi:hypothetical protein
MLKSGMVMRLSVGVQVAARRGIEFQLIPDTRVLAVRRVRQNGVLLDDQVQVDAYIKPEYRRSIFALNEIALTSEVFRCYAPVAANRNSLRGFMNSGDMEWRFE